MPLQGRKLELVLRVSSYEKVHCIIKFNLENFPKFILKFIAIFLQTNRQTRSSTPQPLTPCVENVIQGESSAQQNIEGRGQGKLSPIQSSMGKENKTLVEWTLSGIRMRGPGSFQISFKIMSFSFIS